MAAFVSGEVAIAADAQRMLPTVQTTYNCSSRKQLDVPYTTFWAWDESERSDFIYFDREKWAFLVCLDGRMITGALEKPKDEELEYTEVGVTEKYLEHTNEEARSSVPYIDDINGDSKIEFIGQVGQCVEGPCVGTSYIFQIDGNRIRQLGSIDSWVVTPITEKGRHALAVSEQCFNYDFEVAFTYFSIVEFAQNELRTIPFNRIRNAYPETLRAKLANERSPLGKLVTDAYMGKDIRTLQAAYSSLLKKNPATANLHCDPLDIIRLIAGNS